MLDGPLMQLASLHFTTDNANQLIVHVVILSVGVNVYSLVRTQLKCK